MSWDPPSTADTIWAATDGINERLDRIIALLKKLVPKEVDDE